MKEFNQKAIGTLTTIIVLIALAWWARDVDVMGGISTVLLLLTTSFYWIMYCAIFAFCLLATGIAFIFQKPIQMFRYIRRRIVNSPKWMLGYNDIIKGTNYHLVINNREIVVTSQFLHLKATKTSTVIRFTIFELTFSPGSIVLVILGCITIKIK